MTNSEEINKINLNENETNASQIDLLEDFSGRMISDSMPLARNLMIMQVGNNNHVNINYNRVSTSLQQNQYNHYNLNTSPTNREIKSLTVAKGTVSEQDFVNIYKEVAPKWQELGRHLKLEEYELQTIRLNHSAEGVEEMCYQMLKLWKEQTAGGATYKVLVNALLTAKLKTVAKKFEIRKSTDPALTL